VTTQLEVIGVKLLIDGSESEIKNVLNAIKGSKEHINVNIKLNDKTLAKGRFVY